MLLACTVYFGMLWFRGKYENVADQQEVLAGHCQLTGRYFEFDFTALHSM